jgi:hypothetical protein
MEEGMSQSTTRRAVVAGLAAAPALAVPAVALPGRQLDAAPALAAGGVNLVHHWYNVDRYKPTGFHRELPLIYPAGGRHVRLPISMDIMEDGTSGNINENHWGYLKQFVERARFRGLCTIICVVNAGFYHNGKPWTPNGYMWLLNDPAVRARHISLMSQIAQRIESELDIESVVFQPFNEPNITPSVWYDHQDQLVPAIRTVAPNIWLFIAGHGNQGMFATRDTFQPQNRPWLDSRMIVDCHMYRPNGFTHTNTPGKTWPGFYDERLPASNWRYTGTWDKSVLEADMQPWFDWAASHGLKVHFSEIGVKHLQADAQRANYLSDICDIFEANDAGWSGWDWTGAGGFGIRDYPLTSAALLRGV